jgi:hypothetical protein
MRRILMSAVACCLAATAVQAQEKPEPKPAAWGSLSGKLVNEKTGEPVADVIVFLKSPKNGDFPIHADDKIRKDLVIQIPPGRTFDFRILAHYSYPVDDEKKGSTGQKLTVIGDAVQTHAISIALLLNPPLAADEKTAEVLRKRFQSGDPDFGRADVAYLAAGEKTTVDLKYKAGYRLQSQTYRELKMHLFVFEHPYFAVTKKDGSFTIPRVPAGGEVTVFAWQEDTGFLLTKTGKKMTLKEGKNTLDTGAKK